MEDWIIAIANTSSDGVVIHKFNGTENDVKELLVDFAYADSINDIESFDCGTETIDDIENNGTELNAYGIYDDYHIDYTAIKLDKIAVINK